MYRRIRYVRYKRRIQSEKVRELKLAALLEEKEVRRKLSEFKKQDKLQQRIKLKAEKDQSRRYKADLWVEIKEQKKQVKYEIQKLSAEIKEKEHLHNKIERKQRRRLLRHYMKIQIRNLTHLPGSVNASNIRRLFKSIYNAIVQVKAFLIISLNSAVLFVLSYMTLFLIGQAVTVLTASFFDYPTIVYYYEVYFIISPEDWYHDSVKTVFSAGPLVNLVIGFSFLIIYNSIRENTGSFKLFFLWGYLHAVNMLFGAMLVGTLFDTGFGHVISWMYIMDTGRVLYSIISIFILVLAGLLATRPFLISANSYYNYMGRKSRTFFISAQVLMPYILGNAFLIAIRLPRFIYYDTFIVVTLILSITPIIMACRAYPELYFEEEAKRFRFAWLHALILILVVLFFRGVLETGIRFGG
ncbi:MAG: hypothetical protein K0B05_13910 [Bacteroidales bacterium]|nr:hypothetical protein [Bacteroidales bacterium]